MATLSVRARLDSATLPPAKMLIDGHWVDGALDTKTTFLR